MSTSRKTSAISRVAGAVTAAWLCGSGAAWAGGGSGDLDTVQSFLNALCPILKMTTCPLLPTVTQGVLELAALGNSPPEITHVRTNNLAGSNVYVNNPAAAIPLDPITGATQMPFPLDSTTTPTLSDQLATLTPLAFKSISGSKGTTAAVTQLVDPKADAFLFAVTVSSVGFQFAKSGPVPDMAYFFYDDLFRNNTTFTIGQIAAKFSLPLTVLKSNGFEDPPVMITLLIKATCSGGPTCLQAFAFGGPIGDSSKAVPASQLGIKFALVFGASPASAQPHAIFEVAAPLLVTGASCNDANGLPITGCIPNTDPAYSYFLNTGNNGPRNLGTVTAFGSLGDVGYTPTTSFGIFPPPPAKIGLAPSALAPASNTGPIFQLCAALPDNSTKLKPAVGAYYAIATDGSMLLSAAFPSSSSSTCPAL